METLTREQQRTTELLGEVMSLLTTIASDMAALRATSRVVVDVEGSPPRSALCLRPIAREISLSSRRRCPCGAGGAA